MALRVPLTAYCSTPFAVSHSSLATCGDLLSRRLLQKILGALWLLDGLLQLQPSMFTQNLVNGIMQPAVQGQPGPIAAILKIGVRLTSQHVVLANLSILLVQLTLGICLLSGRMLRPALLASVGWSILVWFGGEGTGMVLTGQASALTGAPGAVLLYAVLGLTAYPRDGSSVDGFLSRQQLRLFLAGFWILTAILQLQPFWWQSHQISQAIAGNEQPGTINGAIFDAPLASLAQLTASGEVIINAAIILIALGLAVGLTLARPERIRPVLIVSISMSVLLWGATEAFGLLLAGSATDPNSGPLLVILALSCWPTMRQSVRSTQSNHATTNDDVPAGRLA
jgi:hypothetical protein